MSLSYSYQIGRLDQEHWHSILDEFRDANVFQTSAFGLAKSDGVKLEHFVLKRGPDVVAAAQIRLIAVPVAGVSIAYILRGPIYDRKGSAPDPGVLREAIKALRLEYVVNRKSIIRISPTFFIEEGAAYTALFQDEGYARVKRKRSGRTIIIGLERPIEELRKGLDQKWRNCLNRAEKNELELLEGRDERMFDLFQEMYREMLARKRIAEPGDIRTFRKMQAMLPDRHKMRVFVGLEKGRPCAGAICSAMGRRGIYLFGATADAGLKNKVSYLVHWRIMRWLMETGCVEYDLHGIDPQANPGVYAFKSGLCGKNGAEVESLGLFDACRGSGSRLVLSFADLVNDQSKKLKNILGKYRGFKG